MVEASEDSDSAEKIHTLEFGVSISSLEVVGFRNGYGYFHRIG